MHNLLWAMANLYDYITILITWLFVFAFLYNLSISINKPDKSLAQISFIMMVSYTSSMVMDPQTATPHLNLFLFDAVTILTLMMWAGFFIKNKPTAFYYLIVGLSFNAFVFFGMHYDSIVLGNMEFWWFWGLYGIGQLTSDLVMAVVLFINKDILGLIKVKNFLVKKMGAH
ncbi:hypothetical protein Q4540_14445 [Pseudoalteromonas carrageenovora]|uniref:hypothetical protein n=1 Tax=Pseudoalteromonas TaxID=53246 RepID=UPI00073212EB|nr:MULTISPECIES: hypothetical protein [Pseudoalteromonas]KTF12903.1 hypothetical protein ATS74_05555 [Pseudoalteromonas sp. H103]MDO6637312.1 hypothetical protein [Pseudoalteromonas carrageenovora]MDO6649700.1 hypothetical protein [Pseudoalteromonas carrageenovora]